MKENHFDKYDKLICEKLLDLILAVKQYFVFQISDSKIKMELGIISERESKKIDYLGNTQRYYNALCNMKTEILGLTNNNVSFERVIRFDDKLLKELRSKEYKTLKPFLIGRIIDENTYTKAREFFKKSDRENSEKVAVKSGYYFEIFNRNEVPDELEKADYQVQLDGERFDLYQGNTLNQERIIDNMFKDKMGFTINNHIVERQEEEEDLDEPE